MEKSCIYCGLKEPLSKSDIIPDALTTAKVINKCVCKDEHNSKFSGLFEDEIIKKLAPITNNMDIKSSKGKTYSEYETMVKFDDIEYQTKISSDIELLNPKKIVVTKDKKHKFGSLKKIQEMQAKSVGKIDEININQSEIVKVTNIDISVFFGLKMNQLITKIAFEWYCLHNNVQEKLDCFDPIINFIVSGSGENPVTFVSNEVIYEMINNRLDFGSHSIFSYVASDNSVNIIVSLFGLAIYNVNILSKQVQQCENNIIFQELTIDAKRHFFCFQNFQELTNHLKNGFREICSVDGQKVMICKDSKDISMKYKVLYNAYYHSFQEDLICMNEPNELVYELLKKRINNIMSVTLLTIRGLKRFVKEYKESFEENNELNPNGTNKRSIMFLYLLFLIGQSKGKIKDMDDLNAWVKQKYTDESIILSDEMSQNIYQQILGTEGHFNLIKEGMLAVEAWVI